MTDPVSLVGLSLASVDALIKLGERTAELISDIHAFENDWADLRNLVNDENIQTKLLCNLLFSKCAVYGGKSLFDQFDPDIQQQIDLFCIELCSILSEGVRLLDNRYGTSKESPSSSFLGLPLVRNHSISSASSQGSSKGRSSPSLPGLLRWSLRDKKRLETIIRTFKDRNYRLKTNIEFWCLASQLGVLPNHLMHLQTDESSRRLGFHKDATLRLHLEVAEEGSDETIESLELLDPSWDLYLKCIKPVDHQGLFAMFTKDGTSYIQENHPYDGDMENIDSRSRDRVESLAKLLHQPKEHVFRILHCVGWRYMAHESSIAFVFEVQPRPDGGSVSLQRLLFETKHRPELGEKFRLAFGLSKCIARMHMVQWLHKSFRSDNILLLPHQIDKDSHDSNLAVNYSEPWVLGFELSRPEPYFSAGQSDFEPKRDIYRHPDRQGQPTDVFKKIHDIYALGVVLLEIGLWEPALKLETNMFSKAKNPHAVQAQLIKHAEKRLEHRVGRRYKDVVLKCLTGDFDVENDTKEDLKLQQAFQQQVVDVIEMAASYV